MNSVRVCVTEETFMLGFFASIKIHKTNYETSFYKLVTDVCFNQL